MQSVAKVFNKMVFGHMAVWIHSADEKSSLAN